MAICPICSKKVERAEKALCCSLCHFYFHCICLKMSPEDFEFCKVDNFIWKCTSCLSNARKCSDNLILSPSIVIKKKCLDKSDKKKNSPSNVNNIEAFEKQIKNVNHNQSIEKSNSVITSEYVNSQLNSISQTIEETKRMLLDKFESMEKDLLSTINAVNHENILLRSEVDTLNLRVNNLEQSTLNNSIDIVGIPLINNNDKLRESVINIFCEVLDENISSDNIISCYQNKIPNTVDNKPNNIVHVKLDTIQKKNSIMKAKKQLKDKMFPFKMQKTQL